MLLPIFQLIGLFGLPEGGIHPLHYAVFIAFGMVLFIQLRIRIAALKVLPEVGDEFDRPHFTGDLEINIKKYLLLSLITIPAIIVYQIIIVAVYPHIVGLFNFTILIPFVLFITPMALIGRKYMSGDNMKKVGNSECMWCDEQSKGMFAFCCNECKEEYYTPATADCADCGVKYDTIMGDPQNQCDECLEKARAEAHAKAAARAAAAAAASSSGGGSSSSSSGSSNGSGKHCTSCGRWEPNENLRNCPSCGGTLR